MLLYLLGAALSWFPSLAFRLLVFRRPLAWWAGLIAAFLTFIISVWIGAALFGHNRSGIGGPAGVASFLTIVLPGSKKKS